MKKTDFEDKVSRATVRILEQEKGPLHIRDIITRLNDGFGLKGENIHQPIRKGNYLFINVGDEKYDLVERATRCEPEPDDEDDIRGIVTPHDMFRRLNTMGRNAVLSLLGEMYMINRAKQPAVAIDYWHQIPSEPFDFSINGSKMIVKSAVRCPDTRIHELTMEECEPPTRGVMVSLQFQCHPEGEFSLDSLQRDIEMSVRKHELLISKLRHNISKNLSDTMRRVMIEQVKFIRFNVIPLRPDNSLPYQHGSYMGIPIYDLHHVPAIRTKSPAGIKGTVVLPSYLSDVRFNVDFKRLKIMPVENIPQHLTEVFNF